MWMMVFVGNSLRLLVLGDGEEKLRDMVLWVYVFYGGIERIVVCWRLVY